MYDACRRYKHFYKKNEEVKSWDKKYHDIDLSDAVKKTNMQLIEAKHNLQEALFKDFNVGCVSIETTYDEPTVIPAMGFNRLFKMDYCGENSKVEFVNSGEFLHCLSHHMHQRWLND